MKKLTASLLLVIISCHLFSQTPLSPEQFLGYPLGSHFTPHYQLVNYYKQLAQGSPSMVKLEEYGKTYEGRPLLLVYIASPEHLQHLEDIRINNLRLAGVSGDNIPPNENTPAIVWLSYNVHGNEPSSSEAAMKMAFEMINPSNQQSKEWLKNLIIIIDPCVNPDGRDRYVNWYNDVAGAVPDPTPSAREHREPWPAGRTNHYNFDLNRDLAWQSQVEIQQRIKKYNQWLPQVHVDYHEQGYNVPYYFAPAAQPYHEVITTWQRNFQELIGRNHAKYFDRNGWLYFTKQVFDLFYPSYGDTYPLYNGAIGMTFEQGGIGAGLAVRNTDGDTLTLKDRLEHHYTTSISTVEIAAQQSAKLVQEFRKFFITAATNGTGEYKTFIVKSKNTSAYKMATLARYMQNNGIEFGFAQNTRPGKGFNYNTGKDETFSIEPNDMILSAYQPKSTMLKVLFEPTSKLVDSVTYDITAWALPYALGLDAYAARERMPDISVKKMTITDKKDSATDPQSAYAYLVPWTDLGSVKMLTAMLKAGVKVRFTESPFSVGNHTYDRGTLIVTKAANRVFGDRLYNILNDIVQKDSTIFDRPIPVKSGFVDKGYDFGSTNVRMIKNSRVALFTGDGINSEATGEVWHFFEQQLHYPLTLINLNDAARIRWRDIDIMIMPDGFYAKLLSDKTALDGLKAWIQQGGKLIAIESAVAQLSDLDFGLKMKKDTSLLKKEDQKNNTSYELLKKFESRERDEVVSSIPGAIYKVDVDNTHPLAFGYRNYYFTLKQDSNIYEFLKTGGWNVGVLKKDNYTSGFAGSKTLQRLKDGLLFGVENYGTGNIVFLADNLMFRSFWESGKLLFQMLFSWWDNKVAGAIK